MTSNNTIDQPNYNCQMQLSNVNENTTPANEVFMVVTYFFGHDSGRKITDQNEVVVAEVHDQPYHVNQLLKNEEEVAANSDYKHKIRFGRDSTTCLEESCKEFEISTTFPQHCYNGESTSK